MPDKKNCFIIMPITTPESLLSTYRDDPKHFKHVLECLFIPAIEKAGFTPQPPTAQGSDLIHAEIIKHLESAEIVLCDMSTLNPNVFFEFGIRTSLNKPVCVVKDELTTQVPFDTGIQFYQEYNSKLEPWNLNDEIELITKHLTTSVERSKGENTIWKYLGFKSEAVPSKDAIDTDSKLEYITYQLDSLRNKIESESIRKSWSPPDSSERIYTHRVPEEIFKFTRSIVPASVNVSRVSTSGSKTVKIYYDGELPSDMAKMISDMIFSRYNLNTDFIVSTATKDTGTDFLSPA